MKRNHFRFFSIVVLFTFLYGASLGLPSVSFAAQGENNGNNNGDHNNDGHGDNGQGGDHENNGNGNDGENNGNNNGDHNEDGHGDNGQGNGNDGENENNGNNDGDHNNDGHGDNGHHNDDEDEDNDQGDEEGDDEDEGDEDESNDEDEENDSEEESDDDSDESEENNDEEEEEEVDESNDEGSGDEEDSEEDEGNSGDEEDSEDDEDNDEDSESSGDEESVDVCTLENILENGSFEIVDDRVGSVHSIFLNALGTTSPNWDVFSSLPGAGLLDAWIATGGFGMEVEYSGVVTTSQDGVHHIELDSHGTGSNSSMSQVVEVPAGNFDLSFWYKPRTTTQGDNTITVSWGGTLVSTADGISPSGWEQISVPLSAETVGSYTLTFAAAGSENSLGGLIDNVVLTCADEEEGGGGDEEEQEDVLPVVTIEKIVINDDGGEAISSDFSFVLTSTEEGAETYTLSSGISASVEPGTYTITEEGPEGYVASFSESCAQGSLVTVVNATYTCTITNDDVEEDSGGDDEEGGGGNEEEDPEEEVVESEPRRGGGGGSGSVVQTGTLQIILTTVNDDGGNFSPADFDVFVNGIEVPQNTPVTFTPGIYTVSEIYTPSSVEGVSTEFRIVAAAVGDGYATTYQVHCGENGTVTINAGTSATCEVVVDDMPAPTPRVLGAVDEESIDAPLPQVLGAVDMLPRTGGASPVILIALFSLFFTGIALRSHEKRA